MRAREVVLSSYHGKPHWACKYPLARALVPSAVQRQCSPAPIEELVVCQHSETEVVVIDGTESEKPRQSASEVFALFSSLEPT